jgi:hypothetical protein
VRVLEGDHTPEPRDCIFVLRENVRTGQCTLSVFFSATEQYVLDLDLCRVTLMSTLNVVDTSNSGIPADQQALVLPAHVQHDLKNTHTFTSLEEEHQRQRLLSSTQISDGTVFQTQKFLLCVPEQDSHEQQGAVVLETNLVFHASKRCGLVDMLQDLIERAKTRGSIQAQTAVFASRTHTPDGGRGMRENHRFHSSPHPSQTQTYVHDYTATRLTRSHSQTKSRSKRTTSGGHLLGLGLF